MDTKGVQDFPELLGLPNNLAVLGGFSFCPGKRFFYTETLSDSEFLVSLIQMFCPRGGPALDPFVSSGTTRVVALRAGRNFVGFETRGAYVNIARKRLKVFRERHDQPGASPCADRHVRCDDRGAARSQ